MKVVINKCWGGFGISRKALHRLRELGNKYALEEIDIGEKYKDSDEVRGDWEKKHNLKHFDTFYTLIPRNDPDLVKVVEELKDKANGRFANLKIVEIPDGVDFEIDDYDGMESIEEKHRSWG